MSGLGIVATGGQGTVGMGVRMYGSFSCLLEHGVLSLGVEGEVVPLCLTPGDLR